MNKLSIHKLAAVAMLELTLKTLVFTWLLLTVSSTSWAQEQHLAQEQEAMIFENNSGNTVTLYWVDDHGKEIQYQTVNADDFVEQAAPEGSNWIVRNQDAVILKRFTFSTEQPIVYAADIPAEAPMLPPVDTGGGAESTFGIPAVGGTNAETDYLTPIQTDPSIADPQWLRKILTDARGQHGLPAVAAGVYYKGGVFAASAVGTRKIDDPTITIREDRFHCGSIAKTFSATLFGVMVDQGQLSWEMTMEQMFPELIDSMQPAYRSVTVAQLLAHTSGMPYQPGVSEQVTDGRASTTSGRRYEYVKAAVADPPQVQPGTKVVYGGGPVIVAAFLERKLNATFESLLQQPVFDPLSMNSPIFGISWTQGKVDGPHEHVIVNGKVVSSGWRTGQDQQARSPVGRNVILNVVDLTKFAGMTLDGAQRRSTFLAPETFERIFTPMPNSNFGMGWQVRVDGPTAKVISHSGTNTRNHAMAFVWANHADYAVCIMTNVDGQPAKGIYQIEKAIGAHMKVVRER